LLEGTIGRWAKKINGGGGFRVNTQTLLGGGGGEKREKRTHKNNLGNFPGVGALKGRETVTRGERKRKKVGVIHLLVKTTSKRK